MKSAQGKIAAAGKREIVLPLAGIADGITFRDSVIFNKEDEKLKIFSSSCTHLGCKISSFKNGELICPCHGSRFDGNGNVVNGPALNPLKEIRYSIDRKKETVRFYV
ncbi:MAG: Rieske (2Fe-2S) protein [Chlorobi bacterium]|nr:Rieske (2Fe-2S) protein [Chlorobiota bacterium]